MDLWLAGCIGATVLNLAAAGGLITVYGAVFRRKASTFTLALALFAGAFFVQNVLFLYFYLDMPLEFSPPTMQVLFGIGLTEGAGLGAMVWTASR